MIKITLLLCLIAVCLSERSYEHSYRKMNTIELRSNEDNELMDNSNEDHDLDYEKRYILSVTGDLKTCDQEVAQLIREIVEIIKGLLDELGDDGQGIIVNLQGILAGVLAAVLNLVASLLALIGILLGGIVNSLISLNTDLTSNIQQVNGVVTTITTQLGHVIVPVAGQVTDIAGSLTTAVTTITGKITILQQLVPGLTDLNLKNTVQALITQLTTLTTGLGQLVEQLVSVVLALVAQILLALSEALLIVNPLITGLTAGTISDPQQIIKEVGDLNAILVNIKGLLDQVIAKLTELPLGINLGQLLEGLINLVNVLLVQLITLLNNLPVANQLTTVIGELTTNQQNLSGLLVRITSS